MFVSSLTYNLGCEDDDRTWYINIENKLSYPVKVETIFTDGSKSKISNIQSNEVRVDWIFWIPQNAGRKAHKGIYQISVYKESDNTLIMQLKGSEIDKYVKYTGKSIYGVDDYQFLFQIKEDDLNVGVNKGMSFEEEVE
jgi:hypothetical protein